MMLPVEDMLQFKQTGKRGICMEKFRSLGSSLIVEGYYFLDS